MTEMLDVVIIGGSYAGCAGALQLGRARRSVVVIDAGQRRNRFAAASHGFLGQDGRDPAELAAAARAEALAYPTVRWREARATAARVIDRTAPPFGGAAGRGRAPAADRTAPPFGGAAGRGRAPAANRTAPPFGGAAGRGHDPAADGGFAIRVEDLATGVVDELHARRVVLASGVVDELPELPGLAERWGSHVFHCPYCHGYELNRGSLGVLGVGPMSVMQARMVADWGPTTLYSRGLFEPDADQLATLADRGVAIERAPITALEGGADVRLADGRLVSHAGLFLLSRTRLASPLAEQLGCAIEDGPFGPFVTTDATKATTVRGVFAAGDLTSPAAGIAFAVADGVRAAVSAHHSIIFAAPHAPR